jgi:hypothetical protein
MEKRRHWDEEHTQMMLSTNLARSHNVPKPFSQGTIDRVAQLYFEPKMWKSIERKLRIRTSAPIQIPPFNSTRIE